MTALSSKSTKHALYQEPPCSLYKAPKPNSRVTATFQKRLPDWLLILVPNQCLLLNSQWPTNLWDFLRLHTPVPLPLHTCWTHVLMAKALWVRKSSRVDRVRESSRVDRGEGGSGSCQENYRWNTQIDSGMIWKPQYIILVLIHSTYTIVLEVSCTGLHQSF